MMGQCMTCKNVLHDDWGGLRGCCCRCYAANYRLVRRGVTTWEDLGLAGKALPNKRPVSTQASLLRAAKAEIARLRSAILSAATAATPDDAPPCSRDTLEPLKPDESLEDCKVYLDAYRAWAANRRRELDEALRDG